MATNLRLRHEAAEAVRRAAERTGRSQQEVIREAVDRHLGLTESNAQDRALDDSLAGGVLRRPRTSFRKSARRIALPDSVTSAELLDRADRI